MKTVGWVVGSLLVLVALAGIGIGMWHLGWFINKADTNKQSEIYNDSFQRQNALVSTLSKNVSDVSAIDVQIAQSDSPDVKVTLKAQRKAIVSQACETAGKLTGTITIPASNQAFIAKECP